MKNAVLTICLALLAAGCGPSGPKEPTPEEARKQLGQMNVSYSEASFIDAARNGDTVAVKLFLQAGMDPNARDSQGRIAYYFHQESTRSMSSAMIELQDARSGRKGEAATALMAAAVAGRTEIVNLLISKGADPSLTDRANQTAAMYSQMAGHQELAKLIEESAAQSKR